MNIDMSKYRVYNAGNKVIAVSTYAGKPVRGIAKCDPEDTFSIDGGKNLAIARCNEKIADKRVKRAMRKHTEAYEAYIAARRFYEKMVEYLNDSLIAQDEAKKRVEDILASLE